MGIFPPGSGRGGGGGGGGGGAPTLAPRRSSQLAEHASLSEAVASKEGKDAVKAAEAATRTMEVALTELGMSMLLLDTGVLDVAEAEEVQARITHATTTLHELRTELTRLRKLPANPAHSQLPTLPLPPGGGGPQMAATLTPRSHLLTHEAGLLPTTMPAGGSSMLELPNMGGPAALHGGAPLQMVHAAGVLPTTTLVAGGPPGATSSTHDPSCSEAPTRAEPLMTSATVVPTTTLQPQAADTRKRSVGFVPGSTPRSTPSPSPDEGTSVRPPRRVSMRQRLSIAVTGFIPARFSTRGSMFSSRRESVQDRGRTPSPFLRFMPKWQPPPPPPGAPGAPEETPREAVPAEEGGRHRFIHVFGGLW
jgi:hypothetical protein